MADEGDIARRDFVRLGGGVALLGAASAVAEAQTKTGAQTETAAHVTAGPQPDAGHDPDTSDILVQTLIDWGVTHVFGLVGDGIGPLIEALRKRQDTIAYVGVRHEESAAFMAGGFAKHSGRLGACVATTGPGAIHLLNGLYDAAFDGAPVIAITGTTFHDLEGMRFYQSVNTLKLMEPVALYNEQVTGPAHALFVGNRACRAAMGGRGVAHLTVAKDTQATKLSADKPSMENHGGRTSASWMPPRGTPPLDQLQAAADVLNAGSRVAILAGQGCMAARPELERLADTLGAPVAKAYLAKALLPDAHPLTTGGIGHLGTLPSRWAMHRCDTVLILGSTMPWIDYYPTPGQARGLQVDLVADRIGLKYPVEIGLVGDVKATLAALQPLLRRKPDRTFLAEAQHRMGEWRTLLDRVAATQKGPRLRPQTAIRALSDLAPANAMFSVDCGTITHYAGRILDIREGQSFTGTGTLVSMAAGLPLAIAAAFAHPDRPSIGIAGDGGFAMLMAELSTAVVHGLNVKMMVLNNDALGEVKFEQRDMGYPEYGCTLGHMDFAAFAESVGARGFRAARVGDLHAAIQAWLAAPGPALLDIQTDPEEAPREPQDLVP